MLVKILLSVLSVKGIWKRILFMGVVDVNKDLFLIVLIRFVNNAISIKENALLNALSIPGFKESSTFVKELNISPLIIYL